MDFSNISYSERFRAVSQFESALGLWVDRIGSSRNELRNSQEFTGRRLGLYAAVRIDEGEGRFFTEKTGWHTVSGGNILLLFPEVVHCYFPEKSWSSSWLVWGGKEAALLEKMGFLDSARPIIGREDGFYRELLGRLDQSMSDWSAESALFRKGLLLQFIHRLHLQQTELAAAPPRRRQLLDTIDWMNSRLSSPPSIEECARRCHLGAAQFRRLFRLTTGQNPREFYLARQIARAKELLASGFTVKDTALRLGFRDPFYFMRIFKQKTGSSPGCWQSGEGKGEKQPFPPSVPPSAPLPASPSVPPPGEE